MQSCTGLGQYGTVQEFSVFAASSAHLAAAIGRGSATLYWNSVLPQTCGLHRVQTRILTLAVGRGGALLTPRRGARLAKHEAAEGRDREGREERSLLA